MVVGRNNIRRDNHKGRCSHGIVTAGCGAVWVELVSVCRRADGRMTYQRMMASLGPARHQARVIMKGTARMGMWQCATV